MFVAIGLGWFELAVWHAALHATWRAWQFLAAPSYLQLLTRPAPPAPSWLRRSPRLYTAALQRFWMEPLTDLLLTQPTQYLAQDFRALDANVVSRLVGMPDAQRAAELVGDRTEVVKGRGLFGGVLAWTADRMNRFEQRLVLQGGGGRLGSIRPPCEEHALPCGPRELARRRLPDARRGSGYHRYTRSGHRRASLAV